MSLPLSAFNKSKTPFSSIISCLTLVCLKFVLHIWSIQQKTAVQLPLSMFWWLNLQCFRQVVFGLHLSHQRLKRKERVWNWLNHLFCFKGTNMTFEILKHQSARGSCVALSSFTEEWHQISQYSLWKFSWLLTFLCRVSNPFLWLRSFSNRVNGLDFDLKPLVGTCVSNQKWWRCDICMFPICICSCPLSFSPKYPIVEIVTIVEALLNFLWW